MMITTTVTRVRTLLMRVKFLTMWCGFVGTDDYDSLGMNGKCDQVKWRKALELEEFSWLDLPTDVVEAILLKLRFEEAMRLACVCKTWRDIIERDPPIYPVGKIPLLLHIKSREGGVDGDIFHYYSLWLNKTFQARFPMGLRGYEIISALDGTLLMYNQDEMLMRLVDPLSGYLLDVPSTKMRISFNGTAMGEHDGLYAIFLIDTSHENQVTVHLFNGKRWALDLVYEVDEPFYMSLNPVYCDGRFYCLSTNGDKLGVFDLSEWDWVLYRVELETYDDDDDDNIHCHYLVDWVDTVMMVRVKNNGSGIHVFLFDRKKMVWEQIDDLRGRSLFLGSTLSAMSLPTTKKLQNRVFLPHFHEDEPKTVIVADSIFCSDKSYFRSKAEHLISSGDKKHATTTICCCKGGGEESRYLGSTQNHKYCTIWYQPFYRRGPKQG